MINDASYGIISYKENSYWEYEYLLINQKSKNWNFWWFPKWHAESWEDGITAAKREFYEEVWFKNIKIIWEKTFSTNYSFREWEEIINKIVTYRVWKINDWDVKIQEEELNWYKRANFSNAEKILSHENNKKILQAVNDYIQNNK